VLDYKDMPIEHIVVDGSNIATEGRSLPSLKQLEEAVAELRRDHPNAEITVIVDATFAHRIDPSELPRFEQAALRGEYVHPPAGAIGRGDAFLLRVAEKVDATVLSNDSFQEFHGEHPWLFERGRLLGATPVPGIGWIFSPRQPVRGPKSHQAVRETEQAKKRVTKAIAVATKEVVKPAGQLPGQAASGAGSRRRRGGGTAPAKAPGGSRDVAKPVALAVNDPLAFISFIAEHRLGELLEGEVEGYTSHGAVVRVGEMRCYIPLANLGDPPPRSAREVLKRHEHGQFVLTALDPQRRGAELALPGIAFVSGHPREETVAAEVRLAKSPGARPEGSRSRPAERARKAAKKVAAEEEASQKTAAEPTVGAPARARRPAKTVTAGASPTRSREKAATRPAAAPRKVKAAAKAPAAKAPVEKLPARRAAAQAAPVKLSAEKRTGARRTGAKKVRAETVRENGAPTKKAPAKQATGKAAPARAAATNKAPARAASTNKAAPTRAAATNKVPARAASTNKAPARAASTNKAALAGGARKKAAVRKIAAAPNPLRERREAPAEKAAGGRRSPLTKARAR
jgi:hypothetical protein